MDFSGRRLPYSALVGSTLDTSLRHLRRLLKFFSPAVLVVDISSGMCWLLLVTLHLELCSSTSISVASPQVQSLVKVYMPVVVSGAVGQTVQNTVEIPQVQFLDKLFMPFVVSGADGQTAPKSVDFLQLQFIDGRRHPGHGAQVDSHGPAVQQTMVFPQLHFLYEVIDVPGMQVVQVLCCVQRHVPSTLAVHQQGRHLPFRGAEAVSHGLSVQADHRDSLLLFMVVDVPVALVVHIPCRGAEADSHGPDCSSDHR